MSTCTTVSCHKSSIVCETAIHRQQGSELDRVECNIREYPPNGSFVEVVGHNVSRFLSGGIFHSINTSSN